MIESEVTVTQIKPQAVMTKRKRSEHYVNNKEFLAALIKYRESVDLAKCREDYD